MSDVPQPPGTPAGGPTEPNPPGSSAGPPLQDPPPPSFDAPPPVGGPPPAAPFGAYVPQQVSARPLSAFGRPLADWWKRLVALIIDGIVLGVVADLIGLVLGFHRFTLVVFDVALGFVYYGVLNGSNRGQTVGKMALRIQVRSETGGPLGIGAGFVRYAVVFVLTLLCGIPELLDGLWPLWDKQRQTWHDKVVKSVVVDAP